MDYCYAQTTQTLKVAKLECQLQETLLQVLTTLVLELMDKTVQIWTLSRFSHLMWHIQFREMDLSLLILLELNKRALTALELLTFVLIRIPNMERYLMIMD